MTEALFAFPKPANLRPGYTWPQAVAIRFFKGAQFDESWETMLNAARAATTLRELGMHDPKSKPTKYFPLWMEAARGAPNRFTEVRALIQCATASGDGIIASTNTNEHWMTNAANAFGRWTVGYNYTVYIAIQPDGTARATGWEGGEPMGVPGCTLEQFANIAEFGHM